MEIEGKDGTKLFLKARVKAVFGRGAGFNTEDLTVSRSHVSLEFKPSAAGTGRSDRVSFEVLGRNPVWVIPGETGKKIQTLRKSETGEIAAGDRFCVSGNLPIWFTLKRRDEVMEERALAGEIELDIDPVKEFGFLVIGKEFDQYPKSRVRDIKQWEWFLEDSTNGNSDDDEDGDKKVRKGLGKKRGRKNGNEDDDWSVESDEDKELMVKSKRVVTPTYSTRSKKTKKDTNASSSCSGAQTKQRGRVDVEDDDDETLGGFIVSDEEANLEEEDESDVDDDEEDEDEDEE
ncbi:unnamed protein product [Arabidopsis lyrata]|uniref:FHA domain-containing protein n=1 Tax=Arabidopsis lyrata subsp. lyrata TaxID=81972 RepID=D7L1I6_ARALL|nr:mitotic apparatus protein p62 [Arabidopsis lyrata subsp. lyrata]EFH59104.1 hypothetical protein ARALYDRAFT_897622 [Arabidopsis lyrata subsp. lyrata]CAH8260382.1 unnamed protein product [Arabidopsis lyrata]|eukprot:XP_002882845.1 mitotic apparatus protein p62 [Arabidopsis lyrata subsp. lyrata]